MSDRNVKILIICGLIVFLGLILLQKINLPSVDLGRHLMNGQVFFQEHSIPTINFYSYTYPEFPFVNHHWGSGVVFYLVYKFFSFVGLSWFYAMIGVLALLFFFDVARKEAGVKTAALISLVFLPLLAVRGEVRPEVFSYLFAGLFFWVCYQIYTSRVDYKYLLVFFVCSAIWVNLHIYFIFGLGIIGAFFLAGLIEFYRLRDFSSLSKMRFYLYSLIVTFFGNLFNPFFVKGFLSPLNIFHEYGYRIVENQSVWFLSGVISYSASRYFLIGFTILLSTLIVYIWHNKQKLKKINIAFIIFTIFFSLIGFLMVRNFTLFGYFAIPLVATWTKPFVKKIEDLSLDNYFLSYLGVAVIVVLVNIPFWQHRTFGAGLAQNVNQAADFYKQNNIKGPILNNYDIGGYLIYHLYPKEKVFVDNRPEAYPLGFFQDVYIPLQEQEGVFSIIDLQYDFQSIFFYRLDLTPWAQNFLINLIDNPDWTPVFVDDYNIIFVKSRGINSQVAEKYPIPKSVFGK